MVATPVASGSPRSPCSPSGPPHIGPRDALVRENAALFKRLEQSQAELANERQTSAALTAARIAEQQSAAAERAALVLHAEQLQATLDATAEEAAIMEARLTAALAKRHAELEACAARLEKTHAALGLTDDKARQLEASKGRLQIDLDGTLNTLEDATRQHRVQQVEAEEQRVLREDALLRDVVAGAEQTAQLAAELEEANAALQRLRERHARAGVKHSAEALGLRHELERMQEKLEIAEATNRAINESEAPALGRLAKVRPGAPLIGPPSLVFTAKVRPMSATGATVRVRADPTVLRGRLQNLVPPKALASPAPTRASR